MKGHRPRSGRPRKPQQNVKLCPGCALIKPVSSFHKNGTHRRADGSDRTYYKRLCALCLV